ncbi:MAG TPA: cation:proton antiporter [Gammaproteobacteria bacterium]|jgi:Kef-type K+ transport system membrane component KefB
MTANSLEFSVFLIFTGAAVLATAVLYARQAILVAYIILGVALGPWGAALVGDAELIADISRIGIMFLLYLIGLDLLPQQLWSMLGEALATTVASSAVFWIIGFAVGWTFGFTPAESAVIGAAMMFSSTIIGVKLMPTTILHHRHTGQMVISVLLLQDLLAIIVLLMLQGYGRGGELLFDILRQLSVLPVLIAVAWVLERQLLVRLLSRFDQFHEYIFLLAIAWCLGIAELAAWLGLSHEIGAFIAGVTLASSPIALFIVEKLKPLRDFFMVLFFFSLGAGFDLDAATAILAPALLLAGCMIVLKPLVFEKLFVLAGERQDTSREVGVRLGQISEFSLLIAVLAVQSQFISDTASYLIQFATLVTFIVSTHIIVRHYPTPIAASDQLRRD